MIQNMGRWSEQGLELAQLPRLRKASSKEQPSGLADHSLPVQLAEGRWVGVSAQVPGWEAEPGEFVALISHITTPPLGSGPHPQPPFFPGHLQMQASPQLEILNFALLCILFLLNRLVSTRKTKLLTSQPESLRHAICNVLESSCEAGVGCGLAWQVGQGSNQAAGAAPVQAGGRRLRLQGGQAGREKVTDQRNMKGKLGRAWDPQTIDSERALC